jgi:hypothetical protein
MKVASALLLLAVTTAAAVASCGTHDEAAAAREASSQCLSDAGGLYQKKIAPLFATDRPQTCNQCHLSGVDLSLFVRADMCETRACLVDLGLVDMKDPDNSEVLSWILRAHPDSMLITQDVIDQEYDAFKAFVEQIAKCGGEACPGVKCPTTSDKEACGSPTDEPSGATPVADGTACDSPSVEAAFRDSVYVWRDRCFPCHFSSQPSTADGAPLFFDVGSDCNASALNTFHNILALGLIDTNDPTQSLILRKPLDPSEGGVTHGGGSKFDGVTDPTYVSFLSFIEYWIGCGTPTP